MSSINQFFSSEVAKFINSETLSDNKLSTNANNLSILSNKEMTPQFGSFLLPKNNVTSTSGSSGFSGVGSAASSFDLSSIISGGDNESLQPWQKEKTEKQLAAITKRTDENTKGSFTGNRPTTGIMSLLGFGRNDEGDKYYNENNQGWIPLQSSNLSAVKFERTIVKDKNGKEKLASKGKLSIKFLSGSTYEYDDVPNVRYNDLMGYSSHGSYFYWNIRGKGVPKPIKAPFVYRKV